MSNNTNRKSTKNSASKSKKNNVAKSKNASKSKNTKKLKSLGSRSITRKGRKVVAPIFLNQSINPDQEARQKQINSVTYNLKHMSGAFIKRIYDELSKEDLDFTFDCKILEPVSGRDMVQIMAINGTKLHHNLIFYKSSGTSRGNHTIKDIWFPCGSCSPHERRITKAEDIYLGSYNDLVAQVDLENNAYAPKNNEPHLKKYGRFINKTNAIISKMLGEGFKCSLP